MKLIVMTTASLLAASSTLAAPVRSPAPSSAAFDRCIAHAQGVTTDLSACGARELKRQDARLNATYRAVLRRTPAGRRDALRADERTWTSQRDSACRAATSEDAGGTAAGLDAQNCRIEKTRTRTAFLQSSR